MKKILFTLLFLFVCTGLNARQTAHELFYSESYLPNSDVPISIGTLTIYDDLMVEIWTRDTNGQEIRYSFKIECVSTKMQTFMVLYSRFGDKETLYKNPYIVLSDKFAVYTDKRNPNSEIVVTLTANEQFQLLNSDKMKNLLNAYKNNIGVFSSFK